MRQRERPKLETHHRHANLDSAVCSWSMTMLHNSVVAVRCVARWHRDSHFFCSFCDGRCPATLRGTREGIIARNQHPWCWIRPVVCFYMQLLARSILYRFCARPGGDHTQLSAKG